METWPELAKGRQDFYKEETSCAIAQKFEIVQQVVYLKIHVRGMVENMGKEGSRP